MVIRFGKYTLTNEGVENDILLLDINNSEEYVAFEPLVLKSVVSPSSFSPDTAMSI